MSIPHGTFRGQRTGSGYTAGYGRNPNEEREYQARLTLERSLEAGRRKAELRRAIATAGTIEELREATLAWIDEQERT